MDWKRQQELIPGGSQTRSKVGRFADNSPTTANRGLGAHIWGDDGRKYLDYDMMLGAVLLGYNTSGPVKDAVLKQLERGSGFGLPSLLEGELAELLLSFYPQHDMARFGKNGADATTAAIRLARAVTGKMGIAYSGYHGCADWYEANGDNYKGIPDFNKELAHSFEFNNLSSLERLLNNTEIDRIGAVIIEQPPERPKEGFYSGLRKLCREHGVIWIQDEIVTGFRYAMGGAQEKYGFEADLTCVGKAMSNGLAISALMGKKEHMMLFTKGVSWSSTFGGELTSIAGSIACIKEYSIGNLPYYTQELTNRLRDALRPIVLDYAVVNGEGGRLIMTFNEERDRLRYMHYMHSRNIFINCRPIFICMAHTEKHIERTIEISGDAIESFK